jgi:hypothetical protein
MASWLFTIMLLLMGWQQRMCLAAGSESITLLVQKYSGSTGLITIEQMQQIIDRIRNCSSDDSNIHTDHLLHRNCASNQDCGSINNVTFYFVPVKNKTLTVSYITFSLHAHYLLKTTFRTTHTSYTNATCFS